MTVGGKRSLPQHRVRLISSPFTSIPRSDGARIPYYANNAVDLLGSVRTAENALQAYAAPGDRERIRIAATEINSMDWTGEWPHVNTLGHAIVLFDSIGELLQHRRVEFSQVWNTRWIGNDTATTPRVFDILDKDNQLQATGRAMAIWRQFLKDQLVATTSSQRVKAYATYSPATGKLSVFLINKATDVSTISLAISQTFHRHPPPRSWMLRGYGSDDARRPGRTTATKGPRPRCALPPVSITVLDITPRTTSPPVPARLKRRISTRAHPTTGARRITAARIARPPSTSNRARTPAAATTSAGSKPASGPSTPLRAGAEGNYSLAVRVASPGSSAAFRLLIDGVDVSGTVGVPNTGDWQQWATVSAGSVHLGAGLHRLRVLADTDGFNVNWISLQETTTAPGHTAAGIIQAEDFDDGGFWDTTTPNYGGEYRSTAVDIESCADSGGGFNVGWIDAGEWLAYTITVATSGVYQLALRVASPYDGRTVGVEIDGDATGSVDVPNTGDWQSWETIRANDVYLTAGTHRLRSLRCRTCSM